jgi:hypothetical protein
VGKRYLGDGARQMLTGHADPIAPPVLAYLALRHLDDVALQRCNRDASGERLVEEAQGFPEVSRQLASR